MLPRLAVVGLNHGHALARAVQAGHAAKLVGLCTRNPDRHRSKALELDAPLFNNLDDMLRQLRPDGVALAAPTSELVSLAKKCLAHHVSVLIEKPGGMNVADVEALQRATAQSHARVVVGYYRRLARQVVALKELLDAGAIGEVCGFSCKLVIRKPRDYFRDWKASRALGGGCLMINAIHDLDLLQHLFGPVESVAAFESNTQPAGDVEHCLAITIKFASGPVGTAVFADQCPSPYAYDTTVAAVSRFPQYPVDSHHFFGTAGSLAFPSFRLHSPADAFSSWYDLLKSALVSNANALIDDPITREIERFALVLRGQALPHATLEDAIRNLKVVEAVRRSVEHSQIVRLY